MKIIIVDDSVSARMMVRRCLEIAGCSDAEFIEAGNGKEARSLLKEHDADFIISDLNVPAMSESLMGERGRTK